MKHVVDKCALDIRELPRPDALDQWGNGAAGGGMRLRLGLAEKSVEQSGIISGGQAICGKRGQ